MRKIVALLLLALAFSGAYADTAVPTPDDPVSSRRAVALGLKLRCLVCQNQSIEDSHADLAGDLRRQIREQIAAGRTDDEIIKYMTDRYGDFVLYEPPFKATTLLLWGGPAVLLIGGALVLVRMVRTRRRTAAAPLSEEERRRAEALLGGEENPS
jgi:cytochrome c-type biogenesis protein CcmH